jgi:hypothetical protein
MAYFVKDPDETLDYQINFGSLLESSETVTSSTFTPDAGLTKVSESFTSAGISTVFISGGTNGTTYKVKCEITTSGGRTYNRTIFVEIKDK